MGDLKKLLHLHIAHNELTALPVEITTLSRICYLDLTGNPLKRLPVEIRDFLEKISSVSI